MSAQNLTLLTDLGLYAGQNDLVFQPVFPAR